jgi:ribosomal protein L4
MFPLGCLLCCVVPCCAADGKTKSLASVLAKVAGAGKKVLLVLEQADEMVMRAGRNLEKLTINVASSVQVGRVMCAEGP